MGIFQNQIQLNRCQVEDVWLRNCSQKLNEKISHINKLLLKLDVNSNENDELTQLFEGVCNLFIRHKAELQTNKMIKVQILCLMKDLVDRKKVEILDKSFKLLSKQFIVNNIYEEFLSKEIKDLYIFSYLEANDLVESLAVQDRFVYNHCGSLEDISEVLRLSQYLKIVLPAQKISLFYTGYKHYFLKQLIDPQFKFNHIYQDTNFIMKYLINYYIIQLTQVDMGII